MPEYKCRSCEHWYPHLEDSGQTGMCAANYKHDVSESMWVCRDFELRDGKTYYIDKSGNKVSEPFYL